METYTPKLVLVPTDFSSPAAHALRYAAALCDRFGSHLFVIHADSFVPPVDFTASPAGTFDLPRQDLIEAAREQLEIFAESNVTTRTPYDIRVMVGNPVHTIVEQVRESGSNLIVMGTHGRTGLQRLLFGSVTEAVMRLAPVPVIAVNAFAPETASTRLVIGRRDTAEARAAIAYAGMLADPELGRFAEVPDTVDIVEAARGKGADLIALGISGRDRTLGDVLHGTPVDRVVQHSACAVLTVNSLAARTIAARAVTVPA